MDLDSNVFLFYPNLIGYGRIVLALVSIWFMPSNCLVTAISYAASAMLDAVDGLAARHFNQSTRFGAMLDQLTDRCASLALLMCLCRFYPQFMFVWQVSAVLDMASHWLHLHSHDLTGSGSHKTVDPNTNPVLRLYYTDKTFLFCMCAGNEAFYSLLYVWHFVCGPVLPLVQVGLVPLLAVLCAPVALAKSAISLVHLIEAAKTIAQYDMAQRNKQKAQ